MKKIFTFMVLCILIGCKSKKDTVQTTTTKTPKTTIVAVTEEQKNWVTALGKQILMTCNTSKFKPFTEKEATPEVRKNMTVERLTKTCLKFRLKYGDFKDLKFVEAHQDKTDKITVYRYKALYEKKIANKELRITVNQDNLISAVNSKDWVDQYHK